MGSKTRAVLWPLLLFLLTLQVAHDLSMDAISEMSWTMDIVLRGVMLSNFFATMSLSWQAEGLSGPTGLIPLMTKLGSVRDGWKENILKTYEERHWMDVPSTVHVLNGLTRFTLLLFQESSSIRGQAQLCVALSAFGALLFPHPVLFVYIYLCHYSFRKVLPDFLNLQWDALIMECNVLAAVLSSALYLPSGVSGGLLSGLQAMTFGLCVSGFRVLLFRLMFGSGLVKLFSGDKSWLDNSAMTWHFLTQPLPGVIAPFLHSLPTTVLKIMSFTALWGAEVTLPLLSAVGLAMPTGDVLGTGTTGLEGASTALRSSAFGGYIALQLAIGTAGNFGFFNLLSGMLSLVLLDDSFLRTLSSLNRWSLGSLGTESDNEDVSSVSSHPVEVEVGAGREAEGDNFRPMLVIRVLCVTMAASLLVAALLVLVSNVTAVYKLLDRCGLTEDLSVVEMDASDDSFPSPEGSTSRGGIGNSERNRSINTAKDDRIRDFMALCAGVADGTGIGRICLQVHATLSVMALGGHYGLFATMTKTRDEVIVEISDDFAAFRTSPPTLAAGLGADCLTSTEIEGLASWTAVQWAYKPGTLLPTERVIPMWPPLHMPRLDWRLWFVPLSPSVRAILKGISGSLSSLATAATKARVEAKVDADVGRSGDKKRGGKADANSTITRQNVPLPPQLLQEEATLLHKARVQVAAALPLWFLTLLTAVLEGEPSVLGLLHSENPKLYEQELHVSQPEHVTGGSGRSAGVRKRRDVTVDLGYDTDALRRHVRVRVVKYQYSSTGAIANFRGAISSSLSSSSSSPSPWCVSEFRTLLPPTDLGTLYKLQDVRDAATSQGHRTSGGKGSPLSRVPAHLKPESAAELIQRTLFKKRQEGMSAGAGAYADSVGSGGVSMGQGKFSPLVGRGVYERKGGKTDMTERDIILADTKETQAQKDKSMQFVKSADLMRR